ncbi:MAG: hypothetical protein JNJ54_14365 [Myxococcaceae bacterium]|nr:hypothetical protein [Myxococcaceae bacterium]
MRLLLLSVLSLAGCGAQKPACPTPAVVNSPLCASTWTAARARCTASSACPSSSGLSCVYPGAGDLSGDCIAAGVAQCQPDAGWVCAQ